jgi:hypothetical protein
MNGAPLDACKKSLNEDIFQCLSHEDRVGFNAFNDTIYEVAPLQQWNESHSFFVKTSLSSLRISGGTNMWPAVEAAVLALNSLKDQTPKCLIAVTNGATSGTPDRCQKILRSGDRSSIRVIFITIGLALKYRTVIHDKCIRNPDRDIILAIDGGGSSSAIEQA